MLIRIIGREDVLKSNYEVLTQITTKNYPAR